MWNSAGGTERCTTLPATRHPWSHLISWSGTSKPFLLQHNKDLVVPTKRRLSRSNKDCSIWCRRKASGFGMKFLSTQSQVRVDRHFICHDGVPSLMLPMRPTLYLLIMCDLIGIRLRRGYSMAMSMPSFYGRHCGLVCTYHFTVKRQGQSIKVFKLSYRWRVGQTWHKLTSWPTAWVLGPRAARYNLEKSSCLHWEAF